MCEAVRSPCKGVHIYEIGPWSRLEKDFCEVYRECFGGPPYFEKYDVRGLWTMFTTIISDAGASPSRCVTVVWWGCRVRKPLPTIRALRRIGTFRCGKTIFRSRLRPLATSLRWRWWKICGGVG